MTNSFAEIRFRTLDMVYIAMFAVLIAACAWISVPAVVPFTMQTFAVFAAVGILGGRRGTMAVMFYLLMAAVGLPVLSGFRGGLGMLLGSTGGYLLGFLLTALEMWAAEKLFGRGQFVLLFSMVVGLLLCYTFGTIWFLILYSNSKESVTVGTALGWCVLPYVIPDGMKIALAMMLTKRLRRSI